MSKRLLDDRYPFTQFSCETKTFEDRMDFSSRMRCPYLMHIGSHPRDQDIIH